MGKTFGAASSAVVVLVAVGLAAVWMGPVYESATERYGAETTEGRIVEVGYRNVGGGDWRVEVRYVYTVEGTPYEGTRLSPTGNDVATEEEARAFVEAHPENSTVGVHYDPSAPERSFLRTEPSALWGRLFLTGLVVAVAASLLVFTLRPFLDPDRFADWRDRVTAVYGAAVAVCIVLAVALFTLGAANVVGTALADTAGPTETTEARVVESDYRKVAGDDDWRVELRYVYTVDGRTYEGTALRSTGTNTVESRADARAFVEAHPENSTLGVHYEPSDPGTAFVRKVSLLDVVLADRTLTTAVVLAGVYAVGTLALVLSLSPLSGIAVVGRVRDRLRPAAAVATLVLVVLVVVWFGVGAVAETYDLRAKNDAAEPTQARMVEVGYYEVDEGSYGSTDVEEWVIELRYVYTVDGRTYEGRTLYSNGDNTVGSEREARSFVESHPENGTFRAYYVRSNPRVSFVRKSSIGGQLLAGLLGGGLAAVVLCAVILFVGGWIVGSDSGE